MFYILSAIDWQAFTDSPMWVSITSGVIGILVIAFAKAITRIFRMGVNFKTELATKEEMDKFKEEIKSDMRAYKDELTKVVMNTCLKLIDEKLKNISSVEQTAIEMKEMKAGLTEQIKNLSEKTNQINNMNENLRILNNRMTKFEYGANNEIRRTE